MARWVALVLGVVLVGVLVGGQPWRADAQTDDGRIAALEARVANLEQTLLLGPVDLACGDGEIVARASESVPLNVRIVWTSEDDALDWAATGAILRNCDLREGG